jgi:uncharacterized protein (DUF362 family)
MTQPSVALIRCTDYSEPKVTEAIRRQFELLGGLEKFVSRGDSVLLKPNFIAPKSRCSAAVTDPMVLIAIAKLLIDFGGKPFIGDSPAWGNIFACVKRLRVEEELRKLNVPVKQLDKPKMCRISDDTVIGISSAALDADRIINVPKFKAHRQLMATFAVKNMFGCVSGKRKALLHFSKGKDEGDFCKMLIDIYRFLNPVLTIIDGITAMEGNGPIRGTPRELGWLICGTEPIACEAVCAKLVSIEPDKLPIVKAARKMRFGCVEFENIRIVGDDFPAQACTDFRPAEPLAIRFSLGHICKSVCKQVWLVVIGFIFAKMRRQRGNGRCGNLLQKHQH